MSCEMRSTITRYRPGSSMRTAPISRNSASTPGGAVARIRSTSAGGKVFSMPKTTPMRIIGEGLWHVHARHLDPLGPVVDRAVAPHVQAVRHLLRGKQERRLFRRG